MWPCTFPCCHWSASAVARSVPVYFCECSAASHPSDGSQSRRRRWGPRTRISLQSWPSLDPSSCWAARSCLTAHFLSTHASCRRVTGLCPGCWWCLIRVAGVNLADLESAWWNCAPSWPSRHLPGRSDLQTNDLSPMSLYASFQSICLRPLR